MVRNTSVIYLFIFGMIINLVFPIIRFQGKNMYPVFFVSIFILFLWLYIIVKSHVYRGISKKIYYVLAILLVMGISFILPIVIFGTPFFIKYFIYELLIYLIMIPFFLFFTCVNVTEKQIDKVVIFSFFIFVFIAFLQWLGVDQAITLYAFESHEATARVGSRLVITGSDPNVGSIIAAFFLMYFVASFIFNKSIFYLFLAFVALAIMFKTQGRTTIIGTGIVLSLYTLFIVKINVVYKVFISFVGGILILWFAQLFDLFYLVEGLTNLSTGSNNSVNVRFDHALYALDNFIKSPFFGWGSALEHYGSVRNMDSEVALIMQRYGSLGLFVIFLIIFKLLNIGIRYKHKKLGVFILLMMSSLTFNMLTNVVFFGAQTVSIITFLIFLTYFLESNEKNYFSPSATVKP